MYSSGSADVEKKKRENERFAEDVARKQFLQKEKEEKLAQMKQEEDRIESEEKRMDAEIKKFEADIKRSEPELIRLHQQNEKNAADLIALQAKQRNDEQKAAREAQLAKMAKNNPTMKPGFGLKK